VLDGEIDVLQYVEVAEPLVDPVHDDDWLVSHAGRLTVASTIHPVAGPVR
jgi:hypothetical protein